MRRVLGEPGQQAVGCVQLGGVAGGVDDGDDGVEAGAGHVVGVALAGAVVGVVVGGEDEAGADGVAGVVDGEYGGAGGGREADLGVGDLLQLAGEAEGGVHQLLVAEDEDAVRIFRQGFGEAGRHRREGGVQPSAVGGGEAVAAAVG